MQAKDGMQPLSGIINHSLNITVEANPRQVAHGRELADRATDIAQFYASIIGDSPYPTLYARAGRERAARRPQPRLFRRAQPAAADLAVRLAKRSDGVRRTTPSFSWLTRSRTSGGARRSGGRTITSSG